MADKWAQFVVNPASQNPQQPPPAAAADKWAQFAVNPNPQTSGTQQDHLKNEGFLESAWNAIKSPFSAAVDMLTPHSRAEKEAQIQKALGWADRFVAAHTNGTDAEKKAVNDEALVALPFGSTVYKAKEGNIPGALGDVAGIAALGGVAKGAGKLKGSGFSEGFSNSLSEAPPSPTGKVVGRIVGAASGKALGGGWEGAAAGGYAGGEIGSKAPAVIPAIRAGIAKVKLRAQQEANPPRPEPAWRNNPEPPAASAPEFSSSPASLPSGRVPGSGEPRTAGTTPQETIAQIQEIAARPATPPPVESPIATAAAPAETAPQSQTPNAENVLEFPANWSPKARDLGRQLQQELGTPPPAETAPPRDFAAEARADRAANSKTLSDALSAGKISLEDAKSMDASHWKMLAEGIGAKIPNAKGISEVLANLKALEPDESAIATAGAAQKTEPTVPNKNALSTAVENEKAAVQRRKLKLNGNRAVQ